MGVSAEFVGINACFCVLGLLVCMLVSAMTKKYRISYLPESAAFMLVGFIAGCFAQLSTETEREFMQMSPSLVFFILLPPIILDAGYTLKRSDFFGSFTPILLLATVGTIINNLVFGYLMYAFASAGWIPLDSASALECLLFGATISATDPVATLSLMGNKLLGADPTLYSLVMGESVLNDAVAIALAKALEHAAGEVDENSPVSAPFGAKELFMALLTFIGVSAGSVVIGVAVGLACSFLCKRVNLVQFPLSEVTIVTLFAYFSYFVAEAAYLSGIMSLFFCSICLAHWNYFNLTPVSRVALAETFRTNAQLAETALYALLGVTTGLSINGQLVTYHPALITLTILLALIARATNVFPLCTLSNFLRPAEKQIPLRMQLPVWFAGLRGGLSFAISLSFPGNHRHLIMGTTLILVIFTTFIQGGLTLPLLRRTGMTTESGVVAQETQERLAGAGANGVNGGDNDEEKDESPPVSPQPLAQSPASPSVAASPASVQFQSPDLGDRLIARWRELDSKYFQPWFGARDVDITEDGIKTPRNATGRIIRMTANGVSQPIPMDLDMDEDVSLSEREPSRSDLSIDPTMEVYVHETTVSHADHPHPEPSAVVFHRDEETVIGPNDSVLTRQSTAASLSIL